MLKTLLAMALVAVSVRAEPAPLQSVQPSIGFAGEAAAGPREHHVGVLASFAGATQPIRGELVFRPASWVSLGFGMGGVPSALGDPLLQAGGVKQGQLSSWSADASLLLHPFRGSFFLGASLGHMSLDAQAPTQAGPVSVSVATQYVSPRLGWLATWDSGFSLGFDVGAQLPLSPEVTAVAPAGKQSNVESLARSLAALPLPTVGLRLGWML